MPRSHYPKAAEGPKAWLAPAIEDDATVHGGNQRSRDELSSVYRYDSTAGRAQEVAEGHKIVLWDNATLLGASVIDQVVVTEGEKEVYGCPKCHGASFKARKTRTPEFRCQDCGHEFDADEREVRAEPVMQFAARYAPRWVDLAGSLSGAQLKSLCVRPSSQHSFQLLRWQEFAKAVEDANGPVLRLLGSAARPLGADPLGGHTRKMVQVRIGEPGFRSAMLEKYGASCAFTGPCPPRALEAAQLYSFAAVGKDADSGGLLIRRDLHSLFESGLLTVDPANSRIYLDPFLSSYPEYERLNGQPLAVELSGEQLRWFGDYWRQLRLSSAG